MQKSLMSKIDAYLFRMAGLVIGFAGCAGLVFNNPLDELFTSVYGILFLLMFGTLGAYSLVSLAREIRGS